MQTQGEKCTLVTNTKGGFLLVLILVVILLVCLQFLSLLAEKQHFFITNSTSYTYNNKISSSFDLHSLSAVAVPIPTTSINSSSNSGCSPNFIRRLESFLFNSNNNCNLNFFMTCNSPAPPFSTREVLILETLFKSHPHACLVILSDTMDSQTGSDILKPLSDLGFRILAISPDLPCLLTGTIALRWYNDVVVGNRNRNIEGNGKANQMIPLAQNLSNLLRIVMLYKYGGVYLDTDFVVLKDLSGLRNAIGAQSIDPATGEWARLNGAVMIFDRGHPLLLKFLNEFVTKFDGTRWGHNGPYLVSRVVRNLERETTAAAGQTTFTVMMPIAFYPVDWTKLPLLFLRPNGSAHQRWAQIQLARLNSMSYGIHLWNKQGKGMMIENGSLAWALISHRCIICAGIQAPF